MKNLTKQHDRASCPSRNELWAFVIGETDDERFEQMAMHVETCDVCIRQIADVDSFPLFPAADDTLSKYATEPDCQRAVDFISAIPSRISEPVPEKIANYRIISRIASGGMGIVYRAWHDDLKRPVVVKVLPKHRSASETAIEQFKQELEAIGNLRHPRIVDAFDGAILDGEAYLAMELLEGNTLKEEVLQRGPLSEKEACSIMRDVVEGIRFMHSKGSIHRDIKPSNLMVLSEGSAKVLDLGLAQRLSLIDSNAWGEVKGSIEYMAPEQAHGGDVDVRADVYSIGATLFYALTGKSPLDCGASLTRSEMLEKAKSDSRPAVRSVNADVNVQLAKVLDRSLSLNPGSRPTMEELEDALVNDGHKRVLAWRRRLVLALLLVACCWFVSSRFRRGEVNTPTRSGSTTHALFHDMFRHGDDSQWHCADSTNGSGVFDASSDAFHIHTVEPTTKVETVLYAGAKGTEGPEYANGIYSLKVRVDSMNSTVGGLFRWKNNSGYYMELIQGRDSHRDVALVRFDDWTPTLLKRYPVGFHPNEGFILQAVFDGPSISVTAWPDKETMPSSPQIDVSDPTYSSGCLALMVGQSPFHDLGPIGGVFDDVLFEVPENSE